MKIVSAFVAAFTIACTSSNPQSAVESCEVVCTEDLDCPSGQTCGDLGMCTAGDACEVGTCTPGEVLACNDDGTARVCDEAGTGVTAHACSFGCNTEANRCNECVPGAQACLADGVLETCGADGRVEATETCELGCVPPNGAAIQAHCGRIQPAWLPTMCDARSDAPAATIEWTTINTGDDAQCTGGIVQQTQPAGPEICVVRHRSIAIDGEVIVKGPRAIAFVADHALTLAANGTIDAGGTSGVNGPGGGFTTSGEAPSLTGGGGAGFRQNGARGGGNGEIATDFGTGGGTYNPLTKLVFEGGARAASAASNGNGNYTPAGGGGGGAVMFVSCEGTVTIHGIIDAGGGGGQGGGDTITLRNGTQIVGGAGGGAGGYVVLQGAQVAVHGMMFANGGGGGGGCATDQCVAPSGQDGAVAGFGGAGGSGPTSRGGIGGIGATAPTNGQNSMSMSPGGGGGSTGRFQVYTPSGVAPVLAPAAAEPAFEPNRTVPVL